MPEQTLEQKTEPINSPLLYTTEDGTQAFVHDTLGDFFLAKELLMLRKSADEIVSEIRRPGVYAYYSGMIDDSDRLVQCIIDAINNEEDSPNDLKKMLDSAILNSNHVSFEKIKSAILASRNPYPDRHDPLMNHAASVDLTRTCRLLRERHTVPENIMVNLYFIVKENIMKNKVWNRNIEESMLRYLSEGEDEYIKIDMLHNLFRNFGTEELCDDLLRYASEDDNRWSIAVELTGRKRNPAIIPPLIDIMRKHGQEISKGRIMVINCNEEMASMYKDTFKLLGYNALVTIRDDNALECAKEYRFDLIINDIRLPKLEEMEYMAALRERYKGLIILCTASWERFHLEEHVERLKIDKVVYKPFNLPEFILWIQKVLDRRGIFFPDYAAFIKEAIVSIGPAALPRLRQYSDDPSPYIRAQVADTITRLKEINT